MLQKTFTLSLLLSISLFASDNKTQENSILETYNKGMFQVNDKIYTYFLNPISKGYEYIIPETGRNGVNNFFNNILFPIKVSNALLQLKFDKALVETERFTINSTFGLLGIMDPAKNELNITTSSEDFGQTLGYYGVGSGPYIVLPILGPSNLRDSIALIPDYYINPTTYVDSRDYNLYKDSEHSYYYNGLNTINENSLNYKKYEYLKENSKDLYNDLKLHYEQKREDLIKK